MGGDPLEMPEEELRARAEGMGVGDLDGAGRGKLLDKLFGELVQPSLVQPTFVVDYPKELSPLAKEKRGAPRLTERFELFVAGEELANAFSELNDPIAQRERFEDQAALRAAGDEEAQVIDEDYIRALEYGLPPTGGRRDRGRPAGHADDRPGVDSGRHPVSHAAGRGVGGVPS